MKLASMLLASLVWLASSAHVLAAQEVATIAVYGEPARAEVGEPFECIVAVEHPADARVEVASASPVPEEPGVSAPSWIALSERRLRRFAIDNQPGRTRTLFSWTVASLEPGERTLAPIKVRVEHDGQEQELEAAPLSISIASVLDVGEDAPRPAKGFRAAPEARGRNARWLAIGLVAIACVSIAAWIWRRRAARKPKSMAPPSALDRLAVLEERTRSAPEHARDITYEVSTLLRHAVDQHVGEERASLTDAAWLARIESDERVPLGVRTSLARMLRDAERIKYALETPTRFALDESLKDARAILEALASAPRTAKEAA